jgi:hypothetical protein
MKLLKRAASLILILTVLTISIPLAGCKQKVVTDPTTGATTTVKVSSEQIIAQIKDISAGLAQAVDEGIELEKTLAAQGVIDAQLEPQIKQWLKDGKTSVDAFNSRLAGYTKFDAASKADIAKFADDALVLIAKLNDEGVLRIKNPRSQLVASGIIAGARVAARILKSYADRQPPVQ